MTIATCQNPMCGCSSCRCDHCECGTAAIGDLEGQVMDVLWEESDSEPTVKDITRWFPALAYTTVATVLDRLADKGLARCRIEKNTRRYSANGSRTAYTAMAMYRPLRKAADAGAALERFVEVLSSEDRELLRDALLRTGKRPTRKGTTGA
jgi:predicted transcriptional regulator